MAQKEKQKLDNIDFSKLSDKEKRDLILSMRRLSGQKGPQKRPAPTTDDELWDWIHAETGDQIPRVAVCDDHCAPFDFASDFYFERERALLVCGARESGKTKISAAVNYANAETKPGVTACVFADIEAQSNKSYSYIKSFVYTVDKDGNKVLKPSIDGEPLRKETRWKNGSIIEVIIGSKSGVNSPHTQKVVADEVDLMDEEIFMESRSISSSKILPNGEVIKAQDIAASTRKTNKGLMQKLMNEIDQAKKYGHKPPWKLYIFCIFENAQEVPNCRAADRVDRENRLKELDKDPCELCECNNIAKGEWSEGNPRTLESVCKGKFFKSRGWMRYSDIIGKFTQNSPNVWVAQLECRRPMADGLYLPTWSRERYCIRGYEPRPEFGLIWMGVDWGGSSNSLSSVLWIQGPLHQPLQVNNTIGTKTTIPQGAYAIFKEINEAAIGATRLADKVVRQEIQYKNRFGGAWRVKGRFADKAGAQQRADWREHNPPLRTHWYLSGKYFDPTVECLQSLVADSLLYVDDQNCPGTADDFESWRSIDGKEVHDSSCLIGNTLVKTRYGDKFIKNIIIGDEVYTRSGLRRVEWSGPTGMRELKCVEFSDGRSLIGTDDHPVWVKNKGWVNLSLLRPFDTIEVWDDKFILNEKLSPIGKYLGIDGPNQINGVQEHTIMGLLTEKAIHTIDNFGKILMEKFPKGMRFIIQILIMIIIQLRILFVLQRENTQRYIGEQKEATGELDHLSTKKQYQERLKKKAIRKKVKNQDRLVVRTLGNLRFYCKRFVLYVEKNFSLSIRIKNFVARVAKLNGIERIAKSLLIASRKFIHLQKRLGNALYAKKISQQINIRKSKPARVSVLRVSNITNGLNENGKSCVYDITVEKDHEFYANGILVHNSHNPASARYCLKNVQGIVKRYNNPRPTLQPMVASRDSAVNPTAALVGVSSPNSAEYTSEKWRESLGHEIGANNGRGGREPWEP